MALQKCAEGIYPVPGQVYTGHQEGGHAAQSQPPFSLRDASAQPPRLYEYMNVEDCSNQDAGCHQVDVSENEPDGSMSGGTDTLRLLKYSAGDGVAVAVAGVGDSDVVKGPTGGSTMTEGTSLSGPAGELLSAFSNTVAAGKNADQDY